MARTLHTEILIDASPETVWSVLTDFAAHADWDPFIASIEGIPREGERLSIRFRNGFAATPTVTRAEANQLLEWRGLWLFAGLFDAKHRFELRDEAGKTRFVHSETFTGLLVPFMGKVLETTQRGFEKLNEQLKARAEARLR